MVTNAWARPTALLDVARFVLVTVLAAYGYTWLKVFVPLLNPALSLRERARFAAGFALLVADRRPPGRRS